MTGSALARVAAPTATTAVVTTALAIAVNLATGQQHSVWLWVAVGGLTLAMFGTSMWLHHRQTEQPEPAPPPATGVELEAVRGRTIDISDVRSTGTGARIADAQVLEDIKISGIRAGQPESPHPQ
ncbi:hypothetical protein [Nocardia sp. NPDC051832]|uniref:hypothetical protein n=1 Tax=Nocardia sp. NPDC051832 TaxID=3155673 RepID=UPI0034361406